MTYIRPTRKTSYGTVAPYLYCIVLYCTVLYGSVAIYGCKGWTLYSKEQKYIDAFKMWCYRRLLRISWTQHKTNEWILRQLEVEIELLGWVKSLKLGYYGHTTGKYESHEKELIQGCK